MKVRLFERASPAVLALAVSCGLGLTAPAMAQTAAPTAPAPSPAPAEPPAAGTATPDQAPAATPRHDAHRGAARRTPTDRVEAYIQRLHTELKITPAQSQQWDAFAQVMRDNAKHMEDAYKQHAADTGHQTALEDLKEYQQIQQAHADDLQKLVPAFQTLYESLSPEQQKAADLTFQRSAERARGMAGHRG
jgi:protein CpxP